MTDFLCWAALCPLKRAEAKVAIRWAFRHCHHGIASIIRALYGTSNIWQQITSFIPAPCDAGERPTHNPLAASNLHQHGPVSQIQPNADSPTDDVEAILSVHTKKLRADLSSKGGHTHSAGRRQCPRQTSLRDLSAANPLARAATDSGTLSETVPMPRETSITSTPVLVRGGVAREWPVSAPTMTIMHRSLHFMAAATRCLDAQGSRHCPWDLPPRDYQSSRPEHERTLFPWSNDKPPRPSSIRGRSS